jgi:hypothetical protein
MTLSKQKPVHRVSAHGRRRTGQHHAHNRHYIKAYWPYLPVFAVLCLGIVFNMLIGRQNHTLGYAANINSQALLAQTNGARTSYKEPALQLNPQLTAAAQTKANDMAQRNYWSHVTPDGKQPWSFVRQAGYQFQAAGENLAYGFGTSDQVVTAWMNSAEHRANLLNANYQDVGFATANVPDYLGAGQQTIVVAMYGEPVGMINTSNVASPVDLGSDAEQVSRLQLLTTANWVQMSVAIVAGSALLLFFMRHAFAWHRVLVRSEEFFLKHPFFDVFLMSAVILMFLLSHAAGTIL